MLGKPSGRWRAGRWLSRAARVSRPSQFKAAEISSFIPLWPRVDKRPNYRALTCSLPPALLSLWVLGSGPGGTCGWHPGLDQTQGSSFLSLAFVSRSLSHRKAMCELSPALHKAGQTACHSSPRGACTAGCTPVGARAGAAAERWECAQSRGMTGRRSRVRWTLRVCAAGRGSCEVAAALACPPLALLTPSCAVAAPPLQRATRAEDCTCSARAPLCPQLPQAPGCSGVEQAVGTVSGRALSPRGGCRGPIKATALLSADRWSPVGDKTLENLWLAGWPGSLSLLHCSLTLIFC